MIQSQLNRPISLPVVGTVATWQALGLVILVVGGGYYYKKKKGKGKIVSVISAPDVDFTIIPSDVRPNSYTTVAGMFKDAKGNPVAVREGFWYVFEVSGVNGKELRAHGSLGNNVSNFSQNIPTPNFRPGNYSIMIRDSPLPPDDPSLMSLPQPYGAGVPPTNPGGLNAVTDRGVSLS